MKTICQVCNKEFDVKPYLIKKGYGKYCSSYCYGIWQQKNKKFPHNYKKVTIECDYCGKVINKSPSAVYDNNFCCMKCKHKWQKESEFMKGSNNPSWLGGHSYYRGANWNKMKKLCLERDNYTCQICGSSVNLCVHHKIPYHNHFDSVTANNLDNLITLCKKCHGTEEVKFIKNNPDISNRTIPFCIPESKICEKCNKIFYPKSIKVRTCPDCQTFTCKECGITFTSKRYDRKIQFCSRDCFHKYQDKNAKTYRKCLVCGKRIKSGRNYCKYCFLHHIKPASKSFRKT